MCKLIEDFENYTIDRQGNVFNLITGICKTPTSNKTGKGYMYVDLYSKGKTKRKYVHRLVAEAFIPNPENKPYINHKDGNPHNNNVDNLEWCSPLENVKHASKVLGVMKAYEKANIKRKKKVKMIDRFSGDTIAVFDSIREAERKTGIKSSNIVANLKGRQEYTRDCIWCYVEENENERN